MSIFATQHLQHADRVIAPDGSSVRALLALSGASMACFELHAGQTTRAVTHRTVEELWFVRSGNGEIWRKCRGVEETTQLTAGVCVSIPRGTHFQFRAAELSSLLIVGVTVPAWPGEDEAVFVIGPWTASEFIVERE